MYRVQGSMIPMHSNPKKRFFKLEELHSFNPIMKSGDLDAFIKNSVELEALSSRYDDDIKPLLYSMKPNTLSPLWDFRKEKISACFTMDAGAKVHILYFSEYENNDLLIKNYSFCGNKNILLVLEQGN